VEQVPYQAVAKGRFERFGLRQAEELLDQISQRVRVGQVVSGLTSIQLNFQAEQQELGQVFDELGIKAGYLASESFKGVCG